MPIYIPEKIKVGFVRREGTFDGKLSYINYINKAKKWALEKSWEKWRDQDLEPVFLDNNPMSGFVIHKGHRRFSDFSGNTTMIRIYHPHGFEFEITPSNLCAVLTHSNTSAGFISQECILGWEGGGVILLPTNSDIYKESKEITEGYKQKLESDLIIGHSYHFSGDNETKHIYLGSYNLFKKNRYSTVDYNKRVKSHFFLKIWETPFEECDEENNIESCSTEDNGSYAEKHKHFYKEVIVAPKSKVWREVQEEEMSTYETYVEDLKDFEKNLNQNKCRIYEFEDLKEKEISSAVNAFVKLKITQNFNNTEENVVHSSDFLENVNNYKINDDELNFVRNSLVLSSENSQSNKEFMFYSFENEDSNVRLYKYWNREYLKKIIGALIIDKKVDWNENTFYNPLETQSGNVHLYKDGYIDKEESDDTLNKLKTEQNIVKYFYNELAKRFVNDITGRVKSPYYSYRQSVYLYSYKFNDDEFDKKYDVAFFEILTSEGFKNLLKDELKKITFVNKTILKFYSIE